MVKVVLVAGGTGFLGRSVVEELQKSDYRVIVSSRKQRAVPTHADIIVNCIGIIREDEQSFHDAHVEMTEWLLRLGKKLQVQQFVQVSALGIDAAATAYQRTKLQAEELVKDSGLPFVIVRPSMIFGKGDKSISLFRKICRTGFFPLLANGKVQPVSVQTVTRVVLAGVEKKIRNRTVEVAGPEVMTYAQLADRIHPGVRIIRLPWFLVSIITLLGIFFKTLPTKEQVMMLRQDTVAKKNIVERLGIKNPTLH